MKQGIDDDKKAIRKAKKTLGITQETADLDTSAETIGADSIDEFSDHKDKKKAKKHRKHRKHSDSQTDMFAREVYSHC
jgi:hypothetical protein